MGSKYPKFYADVMYVYAPLLGVVLHSTEPGLHDELPLRGVKGVLLELEEVRAARGLVFSYGTIHI